MDTRAQQAIGHASSNLCRVWSEQRLDTHTVQQTHARVRGLQNANRREFENHTID